MTRSTVFLTLALTLSGADRAEAHPAPYGHTHVTPEQCEAAERSGLFRCIRPEIEAGRDGRNQRENRQVRDIANQLGLDKDEVRMLHDEVTGQDLSFREILQRARDMFGK